MRIFWLLLVLLLPGVAFAEAAPSAGLAKRIARDPERWEEDGLRLIAGFGGERGLTAEGIDRAIAVDQAAARADALRDLLVADLEGDGAVSAAELADYLLILSARGRGGFSLAIAAADQDRDGALDVAEVAAAGRAAAMAAVSPRKVEAMRDLLAFDADGDGAVNAAELHGGVTSFAAQAAQAGEGEELGGGEAGGG